MSDLDMKSIKEQLAEIRALLEKKDVAAVSWARAAELVGCSAKHLRRMAQKGSLTVVSIEGLPRIPMSEIRRLTAVPEVEGNSRSRPRSRTKSAQKASKSAPRASSSSVEQRVRAMLGTKKR